MKDYTTKRKDAKSFVLNYKVEDDKIIIKHASGKEFIIPYTKENEEKIINKMKDQVEYDGNSFEYKKKYDIIWNIITICAHSMLLTLITIFPNNVPVLKLIAQIALSISIIANTLDIMYVKSVLNDIKKHRLFLNYEKEINDSVRKNQNVLADVKYKTVEVAKNAKKDEPVFNINNIDSIPYKDIKSMTDNIDELEEYDFDSTITLPEMEITVPVPQRTREDEEFAFDYMPKPYTKRRRKR